MKTLAIITDIHGNEPALKAVMHDLSSKNIDHIYCLGDVVGIGPDSNQVLEQLTNRQDISYVVGNHDLAILQLSEVILLRVGMKMCVGIMNGLLNE